MTPPDRTRALVGGGVIAVVAVMMVWTTREVQKPLPPVTSTARSQAATLEPASAPLREQAPVAKAVTDRSSPAPSDTGKEAAPTPVPNAPPRSTDIAAELEEVKGALRDFRATLGGNPVGTNAEITRALLGDNLKQLKLPIPAGSKVNAEGELCDPWGTPYFFHQVSGQEMEVRSAGLDREMWTMDDRQM